MSEASLSKFLNLPVKNERMEKVGEVVDILAKKKDGKIIGILVKPSKINELLDKLPKDENGYIAIPISAIKMNENFIFLNERKIKVLLIRARRYTT